MYYCTDPIYECEDQQVLIDHYNTTSSGIITCFSERKRRIAARVYLGVAIFNAVFVIVTTLIFIYCATGRTTVISSDKSSPKELRKLRKRQTFQKRSVSATTLGAFGHLVFSTSMFMTQAFNNAVGCQLVLWGVVYGFYTWIYAFTLRAYRLHHLFRFNQLKVRYLRMSTADRLACINDADYQWYLKRTRKQKYLAVLPYCLYIASVFLILVIALPSELMAMQTLGTCNVRWGAGLLAGLYAFFICILVPFITWYLRNNSDAHGIRTEVLVDALVGIPFFILYLFWYILNIYNSEALSIYISKTFGPANWVIFFTITAHCFSVVLPIIGYILMENKYWTRCQHKFKKISTRIVRFLSCESTRRIDSEEAITGTAIMPELSMDSLERILADPDMVVQLQDLAIRDFSSENVIFYEKYLELEGKFREEYAHHVDSTNHSSSSKNWINSLTKKSPSIPFKILSSATPFAIHEKDAEEKEDIDKNSALKRFMSIPIPYKLYPDFVRLYEVFIKEDAPIQINISFRARHIIDKAFIALYQKHPELRPKPGTTTTYANPDSFYPNDEDDDDSDLTAEKPNLDNIHVSHHQGVDPPAELNFSMFESARVEVCWNIFNSVYPKLVEMYATIPSLAD
ncbi:hypothetical protein [Parasitella parasitica]|uniref:RGS domain-containing protein n=1 Tax=Parasitella parasitica TaxID=35722 RepID=A0A0B7N0D8_9FUNG|nr:hypothetical protein [Parasitella parasitica]